MRIALKNAVGGWGPYSVAEIVDLFNAHGFTERADVPDAGGARRTIAEEFQGAIDFSSPVQARRYLDLVEDVLEHYPEEGAERPGIDLRRALRRAEVTFLPNGSLRMAALDGQIPPQDPTAGDELWMPDRVRVFMSHLATHRAAVGALSDELNRSAFSCFVAHDDIDPSREWQAVIELALDTCHVLVAYVTPGWSESRWTDQEVGWALGRGLVVIPLRVGADPYGFFGSYQAVPVGEDEKAHAVALKVTRAICIATFRRQRIGAELIVSQLAHAVVDAFTRSGSYEATRRRFELLSLIRPTDWTPDLVHRVETACVENKQVREAGIHREGVPMVFAPEAVRELLRGHGHVVA